MALLPLQDHRCALVWTRSPADATRLAQAHESVFLAELQDAFGYRLARCSRSAPVICTR